MWPLDVEVADIEDLSDPASLRGMRLPAIRPTQQQWPAYQAVGEAIWRKGAMGIVAPSAAHEGHQVVCLFRTAPDVPGVIEIPPPVTHDMIPVIPQGLRT